MVPMGKHIFSFGIISSVLSFVWYFINNKHAEDNIIIYLSNLGYNADGEPNSVAPSDYPFPGLRK